jgi:hypothetical protein
MHGAMYVLAAALQTAAAPGGSPSPAAAAPLRQTEADEYTRYELLAPGSARFHIVYEVTATTAGATRFFNPIRKGSAASEEAVFDRMTGQPLPFRVVSGSDARSGGLPDADAEGQFIAIDLPRKVPADGEVRLLIEKTYQDAKSYFLEGDRIVFSRPLGIKRNAVVLPAGYEVVSCNVPAQVLTENGRLVVSFVNVMPSEAAVVIKGRKLP